MEPDDGWVGQTSHFTFKHSLLPLDHIQVIKGLNEVRHRKSLHLILWHLWFLWDGRHLLQFSPEGKERGGLNKKYYELQKGLQSVQETGTPSYI